MRKKYAVLALTVLAVAAAGGFLYMRHAKSPAASDRNAPPPSVLVQTALPARQELPQYVVAYGDISPARILTLAFPRAVKVARLRVLPGQRVQRGEALVDLTSDPMARAAYQQAYHAEEFARAELKRTEDLMALQLATRSQVDAAARSLKDASAALVAQKQLGGDRATETLHAPVDAVVSAVVLNQGEHVQPGAAILQLGTLDALRVRLGIEPEERSLVRIGMPVSIALIQNSETTRVAKIDAIQEVVDARTQLVNATALLPGGAASLFIPGMHVQGRIEVARHAAWVVPRQAVLQDDAGTYIFQASSGTARRVAVRKVAEVGKLTGIEGELDPKLPVITQGNYELRDGAAIREAHP